MSEVIKCENGHTVKHKDLTRPAYCPQCRRIATRQRRKRREQEDLKLLGYVRVSGRRR